MVETVDGQPLVFSELGYLSDAVSSPLLSFGRLFQRLVHMMACRVCTMQDKELNFKNASLVLEGSIRHVHESQSGTG